MHDIDILAHQWEAITIQPVHVLPGDGEPVIFTNPEEPPKTMYGCRNCNDMLTSEGIDEACPGYDETEVPR